jgi:hypothetical protein
VTCDALYIQYKHETSPVELFADKISPLDFDFFRFFFVVCSCLSSDCVYVVLLYRTLCAPLCRVCATVPYSVPSLQTSAINRITAQGCPSISRSIVSSFEEYVQFPIASENEKG